MPFVKLVGFSMPILGKDPRRLIVLAVKVSQGKLHERNAEHYLSTYPEERVGEWVSKAWAFPSVLEHVVLTFLVEDISRVCSHQLVRHRIASYTQESQRYSESYAVRALKKAVEILEEKGLRVPVKRGDVFRKLLEVASDSEIVEVAKQAFVLPPTMPPRIARSFLEALSKYYDALESGVPMEDARFLLPQAIKTRVLVTMNLRELIHVACLRLAQKAQWEIREVVRAMISEAKRIVPEVDLLIESMCIRES